ncbi:MAG: nucleotidyltransferase domain-containing protein [Candidatus Woesearchaeota archaeon]
MVQNRNDMEMDIILLLIKRESHIRGLANNLDESHSTVFRKLNRLLEKNVVDFRKEGKNKVFYLKDNIISKSYILKAELHKLIIFLSKHPELSVIFEDILKKNDKDLIVLFGSYAKGIEKKNSDIDIYIETKDRNVKRNIESVNSRIRVKIGEFDTKSLLIKEIIKNHIIIQGVEHFYEKK